MPKRAEKPRGKRSSRPKDDRTKLAFELQQLARRQLARRLHDGPIQSVAALAMQADIANRRLSRDPVAAAAELSNLEEVARRTTRELRHLQFALRPLSLETVGLAAALEDLAGQDYELFGVKVNLDIEPGAELGLYFDQKENLFQIALEAVNNARQFGSASKIHVSLRRPKPKTLRLEIEDNGAGFDLEKAEGGRESDKGLGLELMRLRAKLLKAKLKIITQSGLGTTVQLTVPVK